MFVLSYKSKVSKTWVVVGVYTTKKAANAKKEFLARTFGRIAQFKLEKKDA